MSGHPLGAWWCEAYGPPPVGDQQAADGAWPRCFLETEPVERRCATVGECAEVMAAERRRVFDRIGELAAQGDEVAQFLAADLTSSDELLGGPESGRQDS